MFVLVGIAAGLAFASGPEDTRGGVAGGAPPPPQEEHHPVDLRKLLDHDLFDGSAAPLFRVERYVPFAPPVPLAFDARANPDAVLLNGGSKGAVGVRVPVGRAARTVYLLTAGQGTLAVRDIAADGEIRYLDGRTQPLKLMVGEQVWPAWAGATGRSAEPIAIGWNAGGDLLTASLVTVDVSWPDAPIEAITLSPRGGRLALALLAVTVSDAPPVTVVPTADRREVDRYEFRVPGRLDAPLPTALPVTGPAMRWVGVRDGHLAYDDGGRARFWGINLVRDGALPEPAVAAEYARSLANAGFNLVRPHHMDAGGEVTLLNPRRGEAGEPLALPEMLDRYDRFHAELAKAGVYTWLETWTLRSFRKEEGLPYPAGLPVGHKYASFFWGEFEDAKKAWVRALYDRTNPYTGLRYADDPSIAAFELANEDSLLVAWNGGMLERLPGPHRRALDERWNAWLRAKYRTDAALAAAWKGGNRAGLQLGETLSLDSVAREPSTRGRTELYPQARAADLVTFYGELEAAHYAEMARFLKEDLGFRVPIVCNTSFGIPTAEARLADCDVIDLHVYWDPIAESNVFFDHAIVERPLHGRPLERLGWCQAGKPCTMSELNHTWPNRYGQEAPLFWASLLARQDFDAVIWFAYAHGAYDSAPDGPGGALDLAGRFSSWVQMPTASALFRSGELRIAPRQFTRWWSPDGLLRDLAEPSSLWIDLQVSWRSAVENVLRTSFAAEPTGGAAAWQGRVGALAAGGGDATGGSDATPIRWWPEEGRYVVDTPRFQAIIGRSTTPILDREPGSPDPAALRASVASYAAISLASLDGGALGDTAGRALLTLAGRTERDGTLRSNGGPGTLVYGKGPAWMERLVGHVDVRWRGRPEARVLGPDGSRGEKLALTRVGGGWWRIETRHLTSPWVELRTR